MVSTWFPSPKEVAGAAIRLTHGRGQLIRLLRALEAIGADPRTDVPLRFPLVKLVECDVVLLGTLARIRRGRSVLADLVPSLLEIAQDKRRRVTGALAPLLHHRLLPALGGVVVDDRETWSEADRLTLDAVRPSLCGTPMPLNAADAVNLAERAWGDVLPWPWNLRSSRG